MLQTDPIDPRLALEAQAVYTALLGRKAPPIVVARFVDAAGRLHAGRPLTEVEACHAAIAATRDLEALELAARYAKRLPLLTLKFRLMAYLAETLPENQADYVNPRPGLLPALLRLVGMGLHTFWKMLKGLWILARLPRA